jgi:hypothetical protein
MDKTSILSELNSYDYTEDAINSVFRNLDRVFHGSTENIRTPLFGDLSAEEILKLFEKEVWDEDGLEDRLIELEFSNRSKFGPRSFAKPWSERREQTLGYYKTPSNQDQPQIPVFVSELLQPHKVDNVIQYLTNSTSSGLPYMQKKGLVKEEAANYLAALYPPVRTLNPDTKLLDSVFWDIAQPAVLGTRTQEGNKTRDVWVISILMVLFEQMYFRPYLNLAKSKYWRSALVGPDAVAKSITDVIMYALRNGKQLLSIDFSSYDQTVGPRLQKAAFEYIGHSFQAKYRGDITIMLRMMFSHVPLITPSGILTGSHGVPSGSTFTNEVDSIAQYLIAREVAHEGFFQIQGDDGAYAVNDANELKDRFKAFGLTVNDDKSDVSDSYLVYLQNYFSPRYEKNGIIGGIYPVYRALNRLVHMERWDPDIGGDGIDGSDFFSIRALAILENCKHHPLFHSLVKFIIRHDRESLEFSDQGLVEYVRRSRSKGSQEIANQYSDQVRGLKTFESYKLALTLQ